MNNMPFEKKKFKRVDSQFDPTREFINKAIKKFLKKNQIKKLPPQNDIQLFERSFKVSQKSRLILE